MHILNKKLTFIFFVLNTIKGMQNNVIEIKLNAYVPINDKICMDSTDQDQV